MLLKMSDVKASRDRKRGKPRRVRQFVKKEAVTFITYSVITSTVTGYDGNDIGIEVLQILTISRFNHEISDSDNSRHHS